MEEKQKRKALHWGWLVAIACIALGILYPLSAGPAHLAYDHSYIRANTMARVYHPLVWISVHAPKPISDVLMWSWRCAFPKANPKDLVDIFGG